VKTSFLLLFVFSLGVIVGLLKVIPEALLESGIEVYVLYILLFLVGLGIGADQRALASLRQLNLRTLLVPVGVIVGTLLGAGACALLLPQMELREGLAVGSGFGYYSVSSIIITQLHGEELGAVALMANIFRELLTILVAPLLGGGFGCMALVASGGATTMDTTLPVVQKFAGPKYALVAMISGVLLSILAPFLVPLLLP
jgi:uncharacterized membrane protein YbjE (DUF340 family)